MSEQSFQKRWALEDAVEYALGKAMPMFMWQRLSERERTRIVKEVAAELDNSRATAQKQDA